MPAQRHLGCKQLFRICSVSVSVEAGSLSSSKLFGKWCSLILSHSFPDLRRHDPTSESGWVSSYAMLSLCKAGAGAVARGFGLVGSGLLCKAPSDTTRSPTQSEPSSCPSTPPTRCLEVP